MQLSGRNFDMEQLNFWQRMANLTGMKLEYGDLLRMYKYNPRPDSLIGQRMAIVVSEYEDMKYWWMFSLPPHRNH